MNRDVGGLGGVGSNVPSCSEPNLLNLFGGGLNSFGGKLNFFGDKLNSRGGELNSLKRAILAFSYLCFSHLRGGLAYFCSELGVGVIEGRGSSSNFLRVEILNLPLFYCEFNLLYRENVGFISKLCSVYIFLTKYAFLQNC